MMQNDSSAICASRKGHRRLANRALIEDDRHVDLEQRRSGIAGFATLAHNDKRRRKLADVFSFLFSLDQFRGINMSVNACK